MKFYASMVRYGYNYDTVCSRHKTLTAAIDAARECEARGGAKHQIWEVTIKKKKG